MSGIGEDHFGGKDRWEKKKGKTEKAVGEGHMDVFDMLLTEVGRLAVDRERLRCADNDATSNRIGS